MVREGRGGGGRGLGVEGGAAFLTWPWPSGRKR